MLCLKLFIEYDDLMYAPVNMKTKFLNMLKKYFRVLSARLIQFLFIIIFPRIRRVAITYAADDSDCQDGIGAQMQRIFGIKSVSHALHIPYIHSPIVDFIVTQLDPVQSKIERVRYIDVVEHKIFNNFKNYPVLVKNPDRIIIVSNLNLKLLICYILKSFVTRQTFLLKIKLPYPLIDNFSLWYTSLDSLISLKSSATKLDENLLTVAVHFRNGTSSQFTNKEGRWLSDKYFANLLAVIAERNPDKNIKISILTDSPETLIQYQPPDEHIEKWKNAGVNFSNSMATIQPFDFKNSEFCRFNHVSIVHGGDPLEALEIMANSDFLIIGRSSLSYCAAVLNKAGTVIYPPSFWHALKPGWKTSQDFA